MWTGLLKNLRAGYRLSLASSCVMLGLIAAGVTAAPGLKRHRPWLAELWFRSLLRSLNVHLQVEGPAASPASLQVANHVTWLDVVVLGAAGSNGFVSKAEVADWPVVGRLAKVMNTVFLPRGNHQAGAVAEAVRERLQQGYSVVVFPEATTTDGHETRHFFARFFAASIDSGCPVQPIGLRYRVPGGDYYAVPYIGDMSFGQNLAALLKQPRIEVTVTRRAPIKPTGLDRKSLARAARDSIVVGIAQQGVAPSIVAEQGTTGAEMRSITRPADSALSRQAKAS
ncbi:MAG: lysophospholipid acyltransferase family protein [Spongiibacter sp.]|nr:lysophospholipid acyltransferase family protein [Spongiibacter sp.]